MLCPNCQQLIADGAVLCEHCNHIVDASFLGSDITNEPGRPAAPSAPATVPGARPAASPGATRVVQLPAEAEDAEDTTEAGARARSLLEAAAPPAATGEALEDIVARVRHLPLAEQITVWSAGVLLVALGLPWKATAADGEVIGFMAGAWPVGLLAAFVGAAVLLRDHEKLRRFRDRILQAATAASFVALAVCLLYPRVVREEKIVRAGAALHRTVLSEPSFAVYVAILAAAALFGGMVKTLLDADRQ